MANKPMTDYLEDKYGRERSLTETLNSVNSILNRLSVVEAEVAQIRLQCNNVGWHLTQSPQSLGSQPISVLHCTGSGGSILFDDY